jgi:hypothetical protein
VNEIEEEEHEGNTYRDGKIHVLSEKCATCIFRPKERFVEGRTVADLVRETKDDPGATVTCHDTLHARPQADAICRGWWDNLAHLDPLLMMAQDFGIVEEVPPPTDSLFTA